MKIGIPGDFKLHEENFMTIQDSGYALDMMNIHKAHELGVTGSGVKIAILDTGVNLFHEDPPKPFDIISPEAFDDFLDGHGHSSGVLSCAASFAPDADYIIGKVIDDNGDADLDEVVRQIYICIEKQNVR